MPVKALCFESVDIDLVKMNTSKTRRCLFGKPDHAKLRKDLDEQLKETYQDMRSTWSFDNVLDVPIEGGRMEWELLHADSVPAVYSKVYRPTKFARRRLRSVERVCTTEQSSQTPPSSPLPEFSLLESRFTDNVSDSVEDIRRENETTPESRPTSQRQSRIDEYMKVKKRRLNDEDVEVTRPSKSSRRS